MLLVGALAAGFAAGLVAAAFAAGDAAFGAALTAAFGVALPFIMVMFNWLNNSRYRIASLIFNNVADLKQVAKKFGKF